MLSLVDAMTGFGGFILVVVLLAAVRAAGLRMAQQAERPRPGLPRYPANDK
jgi:hypothetical protein